MLSLSLGIQFPFTLATIRVLGSHMALEATALDSEVWGDEVFPKGSSSAELKGELGSWTGRGRGKDSPGRRKCIAEAEIHRQRAQQVQGHWQGEGGREGTGRTTSES